MNFNFNTFNQNNHIVNPNPNSNLLGSPSDPFIYELKVVQQPIRGRMCGLGDKDRRPLTPLPCVRLLIKDSRTGLEVPAFQIADQYLASLVLSTELWSWDGKINLTIVQNDYDFTNNRFFADKNSIGFSSNSPNPANQSVFQMPSNYQFFNSTLNPNLNPHFNLNAMVNPQMMVGASTNQQPFYSSSNPNMPPPQVPTSIPNPMNLNQPVQFNQFNQFNQQNQNLNIQPNLINQPTQPIKPTPTQGNQYSTLISKAQLTRNLVGNTISNARKLHDDKGVLGIWFIFPDISIRIEGQYRIKFLLSRINANLVSPSPASCIITNTYSDIFQIYSAKKFPGVLPTTALNKAFVTQGFKISLKKK
ncbi:velvet factor family protein ASCRUDRAFT_74701 [Ascoidea rubescens DSM 1968]|uniref:Velvet domain-containing protein n=1 Tax=Ascoidea rubescens DSM 1968 TaxID=1344418 RepID=A0A1D2VKZ9_9ASCO|nr:hypothetical protein ASCRUDRAFT_74701 [Ascoidea rubescens DSM 1968]ODV62281.1 hypothetical protein ASCRUDRAFT_74701 [Ascoidea rubescens DSM 1968]